MIAKDPLFSELLNPVPEEDLSISEILTCVPLEELRKLGFPLTEEDYRHHLEDTQRRRAVRQERLATRFRALRQAEELKLRSEAASREAQLHRIALKAITLLVAAYRRGQDWRAVKTWLEKRDAECKGGSLSDLEAWVDSLVVPESLKGKFKRPPDLPDSPTLLGEFDKFCGRAREIVGKKDRFEKLSKYFPELPITLLSRFEEGRFFPSRFAKEALAHLYGVSVKTIERGLTEARRKAANLTNTTPCRSA